FVTHGRVTGAEIHRTGHETLGALATTNGIIAQLHIRMTLVVFLQPFFVERRRKGGTSTVELECTNGSTLFRSVVSTGESAATDSHDHAQHGTVTSSHRWVSSGAQPNSPLMYCLVYNCVGFSNNSLVSPYSTR